MKRSGNRLVLLTAALVLMIWALTGCGGQQTGLRQAVTELSCVDIQGYPAMTGTGGYGAALCWTDYESDRTTVQIVDVKRDRLEAERRLDGAWTMAEETFQDGRLAFYKWDDSTQMVYRFLNAKLEDAGEFRPAEPGGVLSHDGASYYYLSGTALYRQDTATGDTLLVKLEANLRFAFTGEYHPTENVLELWCMLSPYSSECGMALVDLDSGKCLMLQDTVQGMSFTEYGISLRSFKEEESCDLRYAAEDGTYRLATELGDTAMELEMIEGSQYAYRSGGDGGGQELYRLGQTVGHCAMDGGMELNSCWLPEAQVLVNVLYRQSSGSYVLTAVDPAKLTFETCSAAEETPSPMTVDQSIPQVYWGELAGGELPDNMQELRHYADRLEEKYSVSIRLSSQCAQPCQASGEEIVTTDQAGLDDEVGAIYQALEALDRTLALYPDGFFAQFRTELGEGGVQFLPVADFHMDYSVIGLSFESPLWHYVAYTVNAGAPEELLCHEIWHATEDRLTSLQWDAIDSEAWAACNPKGFTYYEDYDTAMSEADGDWLFFGSGQDVHFVDNYSTMNAREDRARIMEYIMGSDDFADELAAQPAIRRKLTLMVEAVRSGFDTTGWGTPRWERPLTQLDNAA